MPRMGRPSPGSGHPAPPIPRAEVEGATGLGEAEGISAALAEAGPFLQVLWEKDMAMAERFPKA